MVKNRETIGEAKKKKKMEWGDMILHIKARLSEKKWKIILYQPKLYHLLHFAP